VDTLGNAYVTGTTVSPHFPVTSNSFNRECGGDGECGATLNVNHLLVSNAFVSKLNPAGSALVYSGFLGEFENVRGQAIAVDLNENVYVTGQTEANGAPTVPIVPPNVPPPPFPITAGAFQPSFGGLTDAFVTKISSSGSTIPYSSYLGGGDEDIGNGIAVDGSANAYITGLAYSTDFPVVGALQATNGGAGDAFLSKVNTNAAGPASLVYSTLLGGSGLDQGNGVAVDASGNAYVTGVTNSTTLGFTPGPSVQPSCKLDFLGVCEGDAFVAKVNPAQVGALSLVYFTYLGGSNGDSGVGIAVDTGGNAYVTGATNSADFPTTAAVFQPHFGGGNNDAFVTKLDPTGSALVYSTFLGGNNAESGNGIAVDTSGSAYVAGQTCSLDFPLSNPLQDSSGGNCDAFISKVSILEGIALNPAGLVFPPQSLNTVSQPQTVTLTNGDAPLTITSIALTGTNPGDFTEINTCGASLAAGAQCTITVTFTPTATGVRRASVAITDSAPGSPQVVSLSGSTSTLTLSASSLSFGTQPVGVTSSPQPVTVTNNGTTTLTISSITASGDFTEANSCTVPLQPTTNCVINVKFTPSAAGPSIGALTLTDDAPGSPQVVLLTGTGVLVSPDFTLSALPPNATVSAGQAASFTLTISPVSGFDQPVSFGCAGVPPAADCSISPNPVIPAGTTPAAATLTIQTGLRTFVPPTFRMKVRPWGTVPRFILPLLLWLVVFSLLTRLRGPRVRRVAAAFGLAVALLALSVGCGGGSSSSVPAGTPAGSYQVTVTGTSGQLTHSTTLLLKVN
jgi:beta-propeller repeat-containing protein/centrosomal CEP192-like protein